MSTISDLATMTIPSDPPECGCVVCDVCLVGDGSAPDAVHRARLVKQGHSPDLYDAWLTAVAVVDGVDRFPIPDCRLLCWSCRRIALVAQGIAGREAAAAVGEVGRFASRVYCTSHAASAVRDILALLEIAVDQIDRAQLNNAVVAHLRGAATELGVDRERMSGGALETLDRWACEDRDQAEQDRLVGLHLATMPWIRSRPSR